MTNQKTNYLGVVFLLITTLSFASINFPKKKNKASFSDLRILQKDTSNVAIFKTIIADVQTQKANRDYGEQTRKLLDSAKAVFSKIENPSTPLLADLYLNLNDYYDNNYKIDEQIQNNETFIALYSKRKDKDLEKLLLIYSELGSAYCEKNQHLTSLERVVNKSQLILDSIFKVSSDKELINKARLGQMSNYRLQSINALYLSDGENLRKAIAGFDTIVKYRNDLDNKNMQLSFALANISDACIQTGEFQKAKRYISYWQELIPKEDAFQNLVATALKFNLYKKQNQIRDATDILERAKGYYDDISERNPYRDDFYYPMLYYFYLDQLENDTISKEKFDNIIAQFFDKSDSKFENHQLIKAYAYDLLIQNDFKNKDFTKTLSYLDDQLEIANTFIKQRLIVNNKVNRLKLAVINKDCGLISSIVTTFLNENYVEDLDGIAPSHPDFTKRISGTMYTADSAIKLSNVLLDAVVQDAFKCDDTFKAAHKLAEYASSLVKLNTSKLFFNSEQEKIITDISSTLLKLRSLSKSNDYLFNDVVLLNLIEQNVMSQLTIKNNINNIKLKYPKAVQTLFDSIQLTDLNIEELKINLKDSIITNELDLQNKLDNLYKEKDELYNELTSLGYEKSVQDITGFNFKTIKSLITEDEIIVRFYNFEEVYAFAIGKSDIQFFDLGPYEQLSKEIKSFVQKIKNIEDFNAERTVLKNKLLPILKLGNRKSSVKIIPSGALALLPFELFFEPDSKVVVNYNTSLQNLSFNTDLDKEANLISFSPVYSKSSQTFSAYRDGFFNLPHAEEEAAYITQLFDGDLYDAERANKNEFVEHSSKYNIIHMAMHALVDETNELNSKLIFSDEDEANLSLSNIYNLNLNADLVTLSACNTGYGKIDPIEGVLSLSRAFQYAGANTTITSLWRIPDKETSLIMKFFYENLKNGETKGDALAKAKKQFLNTVADDNLKHPYYWSGFILTGDPDDAFKTATNPMYLYIIIGVLILSLSILFLYKRSRKN